MTLVDIYASQGKSGRYRPRLNWYDSAQISHLRLLINILAWTPRLHVVTEIFNSALKYQTILLRGTPACGKTVLLRLIHRHVLEHFPHYKVHTDTVIGWLQGMSTNKSRAYMEQQLGGDPQLAKDSLVLIDDDQLWSCFKVLEMDSALFVLFSSFGSPGRYPAEVKTDTPPIFCPAQRISLQQEGSDDDDDDEKPVLILLENDEAHDLLSRLLLSLSTQPTLTNYLIDYVILISGGHAGALAGLLETIILASVSIHFLVADNSLCLINSSLDYIGEMR